MIVFQPDESMTDRPTLPIRDFFLVFHFFFFFIDFCLADENDCHRRQVMCVCVYLSPFTTRFDLKAVKTNTRTRPNLIPPPSRRPVGVAVA